MEHIEICEIGKVRETNQDSIFAASAGQAGLFVVADGMGGHSYGEKASQCITKTFEEWWENFEPEGYSGDFTKMFQALRQAAELANKEIYCKYNQGCVCGSTLTALFIYEGSYGILYAGDSRAYCLSGSRFRQLTVDEVWENQTGLTQEEKKRNWDSCHGRLLNAVGIKEKLECRIFTDSVQPETIFLLCSDGLYKYCSMWHLKQQLKKAKRTGKMEECMGRLLDRVLAGQAKDNISIVLVHV